MPAFVACNDSDSGAISADLPLGWESAEPVAELTQTECAGSPYDNPNERVSFEAGATEVLINYNEAHFRCAQDVEGFVRTVGSGLDVLVQPIEMNPTSPTKCDCLYDITIVLAPVSSGAHQIDVYRRWDNINDPNDPLKIGGELVEVE